MINMPNCKEVARLVASDGLARAAWLNRVLVRLHLVMCRPCRGYAAQLRAIGAVARERSDSGATEKAALEKLQRSILKRCLDGSDANIEDACDRDFEPPATQTDPQ